MPEYAALFSTYQSSQHEPNSSDPSKDVGSDTHKASSNNERTESTDREPSTTSFSEKKTQ